jgi:hypothetical protein
MDNACGTFGEEENVTRIIVCVKLEVKILLLRHKRKWEKNIKSDFQ